MEESPAGGLQAMFARQIPSKAGEGKEEPLQPGTGSWGRFTAQDQELHPERWKFKCSVRE